MYPKYKKWLLLATVALIPILSGCDGCDKKKYVAPPPAPSAPSNLSGSAVSSTEIDLAWKDNSTNEKGFYLYRRTTNSYAREAILEANANSYNDTGLDPETSYWYKVRAYNDGGESGSSNEVNITTPAGPGPEPEPEPEPELQAPSNLSANVVSYKQINLFWQDNSDTEDGFRVRCNIDHSQTNTIAIVEPNTNQYEHCKLQPVTDHKYYIEAFRGKETVGSPQVSATTFEAPVEIVEYWLARGSMRMHYLRGYLKSEATEPCLVELTAQYYISPFYDDEYSEWEIWETCVYTVDLEALADNTFFEFQYILGTETAGDKKVKCDLEITDVEIEY